VTSLVVFAHEAGATVVAEGIETAEEAALLASAGVLLGQGYHLGRPLAAALHEQRRPAPGRVPPVRREDDAVRA
jgi:EAL domain-containing protein (putative c-di-GMP-specific phosphodiesterase class I)